MVMGDSFNSPSFKQDFQHVFTVDQRNVLKMGFDATLTIKCSRELKNIKMIGSYVSPKIKESSENKVGVNNTARWKLGAVSPNSTIAFVFEVDKEQSAPIPQGALGSIQFVLKYQDASGQGRIRVTTVARKFADAAADLQSMSAGFDHEAAAVIIARKVIHLAESNPQPDVLKWIDSKLQLFYQNFEQYIKVVNSTMFSSSLLIFFFFRIIRTVPALLGTVDCCVHIYITSFAHGSCKFSTAHRIKQLTTAIGLREQT